MCWKGFIKNKHVANKDIVVYKVLEKGIFRNKIRAPFYTNMEYKIDGYYSVPQLKPIKKENQTYSIEIEEGLHCFVKNSAISIYI